MYDETIQRSARRQKMTPIEFEHPMQDLVLQCFDKRTVDPVSVILTGTAGDGKTHLCRQVWKALNGDEKEWASDDPLLSLQFSFPKDRSAWPESERPRLFRSVKVHFLRDLSGWVPQERRGLGTGEGSLIAPPLSIHCELLMATRYFLVAANDGTLLDSWRKLPQTDEVKTGAGAV